MRVVQLRPTGRATGVVALFDLEVSNQLRLCSVELTRYPDGRMRSFAPRCRGRHAASFHPELASEITSAAAAALEAAAHGRA